MTAPGFSHPYSLMRYVCSRCEATQWRGLFPEPTFHIRYAVFHGIALGVCVIASKVMFARLGYTTDGWRNGLASLGVVAFLLCLVYGTTIVGEAIVVAGWRCRDCGERGLRLD
jgi:hypothetical protein